MINEIIKKNGVTFGIVTGIISCLLTSAIYAIDLNLFIKPWIGAISIIIYLIIGIVLLSKTKKEINGDFTFKDAFTTYFISAVVGILISTIFNILNEITIKYTINMMQKFGAPSSSINEAIKGMKESSPYDIDSLLKGMITSIVFSSIFGLIMAAFFKTRRSSQE
jgi:hypothetical protein